MTFSRSSSAISRFVAISFLLCSKVGSMVLMLDTMTLGGMITSEPNANEKRVSPVAHRLVIRYSHMTPGSSFGHFPCLSMRDFLRQSMIILLNASAYPLPWGYLGVDMCYLMPYFWKNFGKSLSMNCRPLSVMIDWKMLNWQMMFLYMKHSMSDWVVVVMGSTFTYLVKLSVVMIIMPLP